jgi:hypothetical protein
LIGGRPLATRPRLSQPNQSPAARAVLEELAGHYSPVVRGANYDIVRLGEMVKAQAVNTAIEVVRAVVHAMETVPGGVPADALAAVRRTRAELTAFEAADGARAQLLRSAGERFVRILQEPGAVVAIQNHVGG